MVKFVVVDRENGSLGCNGRNRLTKALKAHNTNVGALQEICIIRTLCHIEASNVAKTSLFFIKIRVHLCHLISAK
jgi:hypothetical protein